MPIFFALIMFFKF